MQQPLNGKTIQGLFDFVENPLTGLSASFLQSAARIICTPLAHKFHTCSLSCILRQVHALTQNVFVLYFLLAQKTLRGFYSESFNEMS